MNATEPHAPSPAHAGTSAGGDMDVAAPRIVAPNTRDLAELGRDLAGWLTARLPGASDMRISNLHYPLGAGLSHETILFDAEWTESGAPRQRGMVVRIKPSARHVFLDDMFTQQYQLMELMHRSGAVPIAEPLWFESDPSLLGASFFVMAKVFGRVAVTFPPYSKQGWLFDSEPHQRRTLWEDSVRMLGRTQTVPVADAQFLHLPGDFAEDFDEEIDRYVRYLEWIDPSRKLGLLREGFDRLMATKPANRPEGIVWGDARLGNLMVGGDYKVVAVMDWEQPSLGGALHDLGWWLYIERMQTELQGLPTLEGMGTRVETVALWEEVSGKSAANFEWYEALACFKLDAISVRMAMNGMVPEKVRAIEPGTRTRHHLSQFPDLFPAG